LEVCDHEPLEAGAEVVIVSCRCSETSKAV
jgi:hypothetical protein